MGDVAIKLIIVSGLSGSGKGIVLGALEDSGYYCVDNLPVALLEAFARQATQDGGAYGKIAVSIDSRSQGRSLDRFAETLALVAKLGVECEVLFLKAEHEVLLKRFSETRRKHPLTNASRSLPEAIRLERKMLEAVEEQADLLIDTTRTNLHQLRQLVSARVGVRQAQVLSLLFQSFGFKHGIPMDADFVFDARCLPNPHWEPSLRSLTGRDQKVIDFLLADELVAEFFTDVTDFLRRWVPRFDEDNRSYLTVAIGCTGGQHRSVYIVEQLAAHLVSSSYNVLTSHRELA